MIVRQQFLLYICNKNAGDKNSSVEYKMQCLGEKKETPQKGKQINKTKLKVKTDQHKTN